MEYLSIAVLVLVVFILVNRSISRKRVKSEQVRIDGFVLNGFPDFSRTEQLEMIYNDHYGLLHDRLRVKQFSNKYFDTIFTVTKADLINHIKVHKDLLKDKGINQNQMDGFWVDKDNETYLYQYRERGQIQSTERFTSLDDLIKRIADDMMSIIPRYSENKSEIVLIKR